MNVRVIWTTAPLSPPAPTYKDLSPARAMKDISVMASLAKVSSVSILSWIRGGLLWQWVILVTAVEPRGIQIFPSSLEVAFDLTRQIGAPLTPLQFNQYRVKHLLVGWASVYNFRFKRQVPLCSKILNSVFGSKSVSQKSNRPLKNGIIVRLQQSTTIVLNILRFQSEKSPLKKG